MKRSAAASSILRRKAAAQLSANRQRWRGKRRRGGGGGGESMAALNSWRKRRKWHGGIWRQPSGITWRGSRQRSIGRQRAWAWQKSGGGASGAAIK